MVESFDISISGFRSLQMRLFFIFIAFYDEQVYIRLAGGK